ncbi:MAG: LytTR family DNA-binding domain-containing protein [Gemmatimonadota bacterium]
MKRASSAPAEGAGEPIRVLLVDDEPPAREGVRLRLETEPDFAVVGEAGDGDSAVKSIRSLEPDVLFLDIQMPGLDGFEVLAALEPEDIPPVVVFLTAYDQHALRAFDTHALDYLLKPYTDDRFRATLDRVRTDLQRRAAEGRNEDLLRMLGHPDADGHAGGRGASLRRIPVRIGKRFRLVRVDDVDWFEAARNYVRLHVAGGGYLARMTMKDLERRLDPDRFVRTHRSAIVNLDRVEEIRPDRNGRLLIWLDGGASVPLGRAYRAGLLELR